MRQRRFKLRATRSRRHGRSDVTYPLIALAEHGSQQADRRRDMVIQMRQKLRHMLSRLATRFQQGQCAACGFLVERLCIGYCFRARTKAREYRHLPCQGVTQRIDGIDTQPVGIRSQLPPQRLVARMRRARQLPRYLLMAALIRGGRLRFIRTGGKRCQHAHAHLGSGLAGKGYGDHFFGRINTRQQGEITLNQQFRFARSGRRLHDE